MSETAFGPNGAETFRGAGLRESERERERGVSEVSRCAVATATLLPGRPRPLPTPIHLLKPGEGQSGGGMVRDEREGEGKRGRFD